MFYLWLGISAESAEIEITFCGLRFMSQQLIRKSSSSSADCRCNSAEHWFIFSNERDLIYIASDSFRLHHQSLALAVASVSQAGKQVALNRWKRSARSWMAKSAVESKEPRARLVSRKEMSLFCDKPNRNQRFSKKWWICWWWCTTLGKNFCSWTGSNRKWAVDLNLIWDDCP